MLIYIQEEWLIVFDNADDLSPEEVARFFPSGNSVVICMFHIAISRAMTIV